MLIGASLVFTAASIGVGLVPTFWSAVALYLVAMAASGVFQPVLQAYLHAVVPGEQRATVLSLSSFVASVSSMGGQAGLGWLSASRSLAVGYVAGGVATVLAIPWLFGMRRMNGPPDRIVGQAGRYSACAELAVPTGVQAAAKRETA
jgi:MFS family permease